METVIINGTLNVSGDVVFEGNTSYIGDTFTVSNNTLVEINGDTTLNGTELVITSNTTVEGKATFNETVDVNGVFKVYNDAEIKGDLVVEKDLYVFGNSVQVLTETLTVEDNIIVLGANNSADVVDLGFTEDIMKMEILFMLVFSEMLQTINFMYLKIIQQTPLYQ